MQVTGSGIYKYSIWEEQNNNYINYSKFLHNEYRSCPFKQSLLVVLYKSYQNQDGF